MVVWDAGSRVDGATQGGRLQLASLFHGTDHPTKEGKTTGSSSPAPRVRTCLPLHDTLASDRATQGFLTRSLSHHFLMSSDTFWHSSFRPSWVLTAALPSLPARPQSQARLY